MEKLKRMRQPRGLMPNFPSEELGGPGVKGSGPFVFSSNVWDQRDLRGLDHGEGSPVDGCGGGGFNDHAHAFYHEDGRIHFDEAASCARCHSSGDAAYWDTLSVDMLLTLDRMFVTSSVT